jgi:hypothetical protein
MSYDPDHHAITIYQDKATRFKSVLPSLFGGLIVVPILFYRHSRKRVFKILALLASVLLLLWETLFLSALYRLLFPRPVVVVTDKGIDYRPLSNWFVALGMTMQWEEMAAMYLNELTLRGKKRTVTYRALCIMPRDQEMYFQQHKLLRPRRLPLLVMMSKIGSPFLLPEQLIFPLTLDELLSQIRVHFQEQIQANGIEIREEQKISIG